MIRNEESELCTEVRSPYYYYYLYISPIKTKQTENLDFAKPGKRYGLSKKPRSKAFRLRAKAGKPRLGQSGWFAGVLQERSCGRSQGYETHATVGSCGCLISSATRVSRLVAFVVRAVAVIRLDSENEENLVSYLRLIYISSSNC